MKARLMSWPADQIPVFAKEYPRIRDGEFDHKFDVILYHIVEVQAASTSNDGERRPKGWSFTSLGPNRQKAGYATEKAYWEEEVLIQFDVYAKSADRADDLVDWWHRSLLYFAHGLKWFLGRGVNGFRFVRRLEDKMTKEFGQELYHRSLQYTMRLQLSELFDAKLLDDINLAINGEEINLDGQSEPPTP